MPPTTCKPAVSGDRNSVVDRATAPLRRSLAMSFWKSPRICSGKEWSLTKTKVASGSSFMRRASPQRNSTSPPLRSCSSTIPRAGSTSPSHKTSYPMQRVAPKASANRHVDPKPLPTTIARISSRDSSSRAAATAGEDATSCQPWNQIVWSNPTVPLARPPKCRSLLTAHGTIHSELFSCLRTAANAPGNRLDSLAGIALQAVLNTLLSFSRMPAKSSVITGGEFIANWTGGHCLKTSAHCAWYGEASLLRICAQCSEAFRSGRVFCATSRWLQNVAWARSCLRALRRSRAKCWFGSAFTASSK
mmetsp:Transcript_77559/g.202157  ORF Transcript_77559/g.202157 Transcript_77559/m.202157 type:complete len:304 (-) Transcript_77559:191-1102(-)